MMSDWEREIRWRQMQRDEDEHPLVTIRLLRIGLAVSLLGNLALAGLLWALGGSIR